MAGSKTAAQPVGRDTRVKGAALPALNYQPTGSFKDIEKLEAKLAQKNEVLAELMQEHVQLKKELGEL